MKSIKNIIGHVIIFVVVIATVLFVSSCKKDNINSTYVAKPVVQAYLAAGQQISVYIKKEILIGSTDTTTQTIDNLIVKISFSGNTVTLTPKGKGIYMSDPTNIAVAGQTYNLDFIYNGTEITASTIVPSKPAGVVISATTLSIPANTFNYSSITPLTLSWNNPDNEYFMVLAQTNDTLSPIDTSSHFRHTFFRNQPVQSGTYQLSPRDFSYYGNYNVILYKLNADYAALYNSTGNNSQNLTKPISNINNGLGIFSGINADTLKITIDQ
jgi:hypothetical protein